MAEQFDLELFENDAHQNGIRYWIAHDFMQHLGYESWNTFKSVINKAMSSCANLEIDIMDNFTQVDTVFQGKEVKSFKLSRFACFLVTMHADSKKEQVAQAKTILAAVADKLVQNAIDDEAIQRLEVRKKLADGEQVMSASAKSAGLLPEHFGLFKDSGFRGMYNMSLAELKRFKHIPDDKRTLYDFMGNTELAGNWFRVTQTAERIKSQRVKGLPALQQTASQVGKEVRDMMIKNSGIAPEHLELEQDIKQVKKTLKGANKEMIKYDKPKKLPNKKNK
ncbi:damage-inducible protein D [Lonepinella koalarum]|uniref:BRO family protein n=1 Tax=Lonepinella koalarum TaxID=53417 RepID=UPI0011E47E1E|nr:BRO family protein [Lonepinella koalarum]TYG33274.1 damage-inducible protein D [Lonepinella koalarum]TYG33562.1 damage-inducible protein D [Lonepinella koalarum]